MFISILMLSLPVLRGEPSDSTSVQRYNFTLSTEKAYLSGIMIVKENPEDITGSMVNQFGISAIDFRYNKSRKSVKLISLAGFLDKWYIRRILREDIKYCLHVLYMTPYKRKHNYVLRQTVDSCTIENTRRHLTYTFSPLTVNRPENDTQR